MVVASAISFTPLAGLASYAASKAGVEMLALAYRQEVAHLGITVGLVHPSWIDTDLVRGAEADLPSFQELRGRLPYPGNVTTSVDRAAAAIVRGLVRRRSRVYVPRAVVVANWAKAALNSPAAWPWMRRFAAEVTPALEREVAALGRHDQLVPGSETRSAPNSSTKHSDSPRRSIAESRTKVDRHEGIRRRAVRQGRHPRRPRTRAEGRQQRRPGPGERRQHQPAGQDDPQR